MCYGARDPHIATLDLSPETRAQPVPPHKPNHPGDASSTTFRPSYTHFHRVLPDARLAVFVSGGGSNLRALQDAVERGRVAGEVAAVLSDKTECGGVAFAREQGIPTHVYPVADGEGLSPDGLVELLQGDLGVDFIVLAGYLKLIPPELCRAYPRGILNIHPALLPAFGGKGFYGKRVHRAVVESGARFSGATVHFVDEEYDRGPILAQRAVEVRPHDSADDLAARVLQEEHRVLPEAVAALCSGHVEWREDGVPFIWRAS